MNATWLHEGGCLCGAVRYRVRGPALRTLVCHCRFCQKMTGSTSYANAVFPVEAVDVMGTPGSYTHTSEASGKAVHVHFCPRCGTTVSLTFERWPQYRAISRGTFDDPDWVSVEAHIWTDSAQEGVILPAGIDCYRHARANLDGSIEAAERFAAPIAAKRGA